jgi:hypothetical protein
VPLLPVLVFEIVLLAACGGKAAVSPSPTSAPTSTDTPSPSPTFTSTATATATPTQTVTPTSTQTPIPQPASLTGTVYLLGDSAKPFVSSIELRQKDSFNLIASGDTDSHGVYRIEGIEPGDYELWTLMTKNTTMVSGCMDIVPPDGTWKLGIKFSEGQALTMGATGLSNAFMLAESLQASGMQAQGFYSVLEGFKIESGVENQMDITLLCK